MALTIAVLHSCPYPTISSKQILNEAKKLGCKTKYLRPQEITASLESFNTKIYRGDKALNIDILFPRGIGSVSAIEMFLWRLDIIKLFECMGVLSINSYDSITRTRDKFSALLILSSNKIPIPETIVTESLAVALKTIEEWGKVLVKPLIGSFGRGIILLDNPDIAYPIIKQLLSWSQPLMIQKYYEKKNRRDLRVLVINGEAYASYWRIAKEGSFKTNVAQGGTVAEAKVPDDVLEIAIKTTEALGLFYAGVDLMEDAEGRFMVLEANASPLWKGAVKLGYNPAKKLVNEVLKAYRR